MPRRRTKFIWPPPPTMASANDSTPTSTSPAEPRFKRLRVESVSTPRAQEALTEEENILHDDEAYGQAERESTHSSQPNQPAQNLTPSNPPSSYQTAVEAYLKEPMSSQIMRYQNWRRQGSAHDDWCFVCERPKNPSLVPCNTCRRSFHDACLPPGSFYDGQNRWYCAVCVHRNWHVEPPTMTPPASPPLSAQGSSLHDIPDRQLTDDGSTISNLRSGATTTEAGSGNPQALSILADISRSMSRGVPNKSSPEFVTVASSYSPAPASPHPSATPGSVPSTAQRHDIPMPSTSGSQRFSLLDSHARKSRFATLSSEVDSALWVLYRELESSNSLRQYIAELEAEVVKLRQDVSIRDNQLILSQRMSQSGRVSQADIDSLRAQAAKGEAATREMDALRARNEELDRQLKDAKAESAAMTESLNEWKGKLVSLLGK